MRAIIETEMVSGDEELDDIPVREVEIVGYNGKTSVDVLFEGRRYAVNITDLYIRGIGGTRMAVPRKELFAKFHVEEQNKIMAAGTAM